MCRISDSVNCLFHACCWPQDPFIRGHPFLPLNCQKHFLSTHRKCVRFKIMFLFDKIHPLFRKN